MRARSPAKGETILNLVNEGNCCHMHSRSGCAELHIRNSCQPLPKGSDSDRSPRFGICLTHCDLPCKTLRRHFRLSSGMPPFFEICSDPVTGPAQSNPRADLEQPPAPLQPAPAISILNSLTAPASLDTPSRPEVINLARESGQLLKQICMPRAPNPLHPHQRLPILLRPATFPLAWRVNHLDSGQLVYWIRGPAETVSHRSTMWHSSRAS